jgi:hypothetical protein
MITRIVLLLLLLAAGSAIQTAAGLPQTVDDSARVQLDTTLSGIAPLRTVTIGGVGDIMLGTSFPSRKFLPPGNSPIPLLAELADTLKSVDLLFGNLEGAFLDQGDPVKACRDTTKCYLFRMPESYAGALVYAGFDILSLANNHVSDFGQPAVRRTRSILDSLGIYYAGQLAAPYVIFEKDSLTYGFCAFAPNAGTVNFNDLKGAEAIVRKLSEECDIVIVSFHGGAEGAEFQRVTRQTESYHGENRGNVYQFAHMVIDAGADIVFGHGPHVTRAVEVYKNRFIAYSLGNFCTYGRFNITGPNGIAPVVMLDVDTAGRFVAGRIVPVYQGSDGKVRIDPKLRVINKIRELNELDFPENEIVVTENGYILYK